jgi:Na+/proline symporter
MKPFIPLPLAVAMTCLNFLFMLMDYFLGGRSIEIGVLCLLFGAWAIWGITILPKK